MTKYKNLAVLLGILISSPVANSAISFNFTYQDVIDGSGFGFDDAAEGALRRSTVEAVGNYLNTVLDHTASIDVTWNQSINAPGSSTLASMGTSYFLNQGVYGGIMNDHIISGVDPSGGGDDASGQINFARTWNSGLDPVAAGESDLFSVVLHEFTHALGGASLIESDGTSAISGTYSTYDTLLRNSTNNQIINNAGTFIGNVADLTSGDVTIIASSNIYDIYAPNSFQDGSSISHFDQSVDAVMNPSINTGNQQREYAAADRDLLSALGYTLQPIPEPSSTLLIGIGSLALIMRRRK